MFKSQYFSTKEDKSNLQKIVKDIQNILITNNAKLIFSKNGFTLSVKDQKMNSNIQLYGEFPESCLYSFEEPKIIKFIKRDQND